MEQDIAKIVQDIEDEQALGKVSGVQVFRSALNQPALVSISSANATSVPSQNGYYAFNVNLPRPILHAETLQMLDAVIPLPTTNIPDTACAFWYYRLSAYSGYEPNTNNLYFVRLLPSYYKQEFIINPSNYGFNQTFNTYSNVATQLALACSNDLAFNNILTAYQSGITGLSNQPVNYIPNDISLTYNSNLNKFQMTGSNAFTPFATTAWSSSNTYALNDVIYFSNSNTLPNIAPYQSLQASNSNKNPYTQTAWWKRIYTDIVQPWDIDTQYRKGQLVSWSNGYVYQAQYDTHLNGPSTDALQNWDALRYYQLNDYVIYVGIVTTQGYRCIRPNTAIDPTGVSGPSYWTRAEWNDISIYPINCRIYHTATNKVYESLIANNLNNTPGSSPAWKNIGSAVVWLLYNSLGTSANYRYLITGYNDPNVVLNQGTGQRQWSPFALYEANAKVQYNGVYYTALQQNQNYKPFDLPTPTTWTTSRTFNPGDCASYLGDNYYAVITTGPANPQAPAFSSSNYWIPQEWDSTLTYPVGFICTYVAPNSSRQYFLAIAQSKGQYPAGGSAFWQPQLWTTGGSVPTIGLNYLSSTYDMMEINNSGANYPVPYGIPGQPFIVPVRRLLNSILGFTWNGQYDASTYTFANLFDPANTLSSTNENAVQLLNRLRPVPPYTVVTLIGEGEYTINRPSYFTQTYTADGYANLVYTSIVSVYATVVGASTLNTQSSTNLLAIALMNAGNLGVGYHQNFLEDPLKVFHNDIYTIGIELRDEMDEPYILTNNAVCTFTMKLTYKE